MSHRQIMILVAQRPVEGLGCFVLKPGQQHDFVGALGQGQL